MFQPLTGLVARENERELARRFAIAGKARQARDAACGRAEANAGPGRTASQDPAPRCASTLQQADDHTGASRERARSTARAPAA
jgi:hypothetical protein